MRSTRVLASAAVLVALPFVLMALGTLFPSVGLIPYLPYQLYYVPLALLLDQPFFGHDSELGILVLPLGAILTPTAYLLVLFLVVKAAAWMRSRRRN